MSAASISHNSPTSSPLGSARHSHHHHITTPRASNARPPTSTAPVHTPRQSRSRPSTLSHQDGSEASPNYFNLTIDSSKSCQSSAAGGAHARANFSPPSSRVRSTAAISPSIIPLDQNPEFAEFKRQTELRSSQNGMLHFQFPPTQQQAPPSPTPHMSQPTPEHSPPKNIIGSVLSEERPPRSPKRTLSSPYTNITDQPRRVSPASFTEREAAAAPQGLHSVQDEQVRFSLPPRTSQGRVPTLASAHAETLPDTTPRGGSKDISDFPPFISPSHLVTIIEAHEEEILLLDLRVATQYARSRIRGALNLCIPTTLLKRPAYKTSKLAETFNKAPEQQKKFERWRKCKYIVVYDANASKPRDALTCVNMLKKFAAEGWAGSSYIIRGGFVDFSKYFPNLIQHAGSSQMGLGSPSLAASSPSHSLAPVIGGCPIPVTKNAANPFFGNIRQNMDLIGGVGQIAVQRPTSFNDGQPEELPAWLREASSEKDKGKLASGKFLAIEKQEQKRMQEALSGNVKYGTPTPGATPAVQIAGIEKGAKNRYNNIWPYEHSRVKLEGVADGGCDYINANHVKAKWSKKRYIATQGPIPTTFKDFWNVVWQQDVRAIVMLTAESEGGQLKAHNYWSDKHFGPLHLTFLSEHRASIEPSKIRRRRKAKPSNIRRTSTSSDMDGPSAALQTPPSSEQPYVMVRRFMLSNDQEPFARMRQITQLQYSNWPDFGAPADPSHLLGLVEQCNNVVRASRSSSPTSAESEDDRPILVHCSAGCGRTGTFCTVSSVIDMLKQQKAYNIAQGRQHTPMEVDFGHLSTNSFRDSMDTTERDYVGPVQNRAGERNWLARDDIDLVEKTVQDFRLQRLSMVQSLRQYVLCYETVLEWLAEQSP